ncbi:hypothetical protein ScPMuIL_010625 [Solemya velum]
MTEFETLLRHLHEESFIVKDQVRHEIRLNNIKNEKKMKSPRFKATVRLFAADGIFDDSIPVKVKICSENKSEATKETTLTGDEAYLHKTKGEAIIEASFEKIEFGKFKRDKDVSVCESRYQLIFTTSLCCLGLEFQLQTVSLPVLVVTGNKKLQGNDGLCGITWQCFMSDDAFACPLVCPQSQPWPKVGEMLSRRVHHLFKKGLTEKQLIHLAQFLTGGQIEDYSQEMIEAKQLTAKVHKNKQGKAFSFWTWFLGTNRLIEECLEPYWFAGLIEGYISKRGQARSSTRLENFCEVEHLCPFTEDAMKLEGLANLIIERPLYYQICKELYPANKGVKEVFRNLRDKKSDVQQPIDDYKSIHDRFSKMSINNGGIQEKPSPDATLFTSVETAASEQSKVELKRPVEYSADHGQQMKKQRMDTPNYKHHSGGTFQINDNAADENPQDNCRYDVLVDDLEPSFQTSPFLDNYRSRGQTVSFSFLTVMSKLLLVVQISQDFGSSRSKQKKMVARDSNVQERQRRKRQNRV